MYHNDYFKICVKAEHNMTHVMSQPAMPFSMELFIAGVSKLFQYIALWFEVHVCRPLYFTIDNNGK